MGGREAQLRGDMIKAAHPFSDCRASGAAAAAALSYYVYRTARAGPI